MNKKVTENTEQIDYTNYEVNDKDYPTLYQN